MTNRKIRYIAVLSFVFLMFLTSKITGNTLIIFPEILAVLAGAWYSERMLWKTGRVRMVIIMAIAAFAGVGISRFVPAPLYVKGVVGFVFTALVLIISDCRLTPAISACMLPIFLGTESFEYSFLVTVMMIIVALGQKLMVSLGIKEGNVHFHYMPDFEEQLKLWAILFVAYMLISIYPLMSGNIYVMLPPLIVMFVENSSHNFKGCRVRIWLTVLIAALIGGACQFVLVDWFRWPVYIAGTVSAALILWAQSAMKMGFPPACAIALFPFLLPDWVLLYPFAVFAGSGVMMLVSTFIQKKFVIMGAD